MQKSGSLAAEPIRGAWSDEKLLLEYRAATDRPAFEELVRRYEKELYGYLRHYLGDAETAEDVFQQTFLQVHLKCDQFEPERKLRPWLYAVATNQAIDFQRGNARHRMASLDRRMGGMDGDEPGRWWNFRQPERDRPKKAVAAEQRRSAGPWMNCRNRRDKCMLVYFQGLKYREAADVLSIPVGTVKSRLHAAIQKLGEALAPS